MPGGDPLVSTVACAPLWLAFNASGSTLYVASSQRVLEIRDALHGHRLIRNLPIAGFISDLKLSQDRTTLLVTSNQAVTLVDTETNLPRGQIQGPFQLTSSARLAVVAQIEVAREPSGLAFSRDGRQCFVACRKDGCLMMLDGKTRGAHLHHRAPAQCRSLRRGRASLNIRQLMSPGERPGVCASGRRLEWMWG